jgi:hypothetical protein
MVTNDIGLRDVVGPVPSPCHTLPKPLSTVKLGSTIGIMKNKNKNIFDNLFLEESYLSSIIPPSSL